MARKMRLTPERLAPEHLAPEHLALFPPFSGETGRLAGRSDVPTEAEWEAVADSLLANAPADGQIWIFAYGSLIWNPGFDYVEERLGTARGWRRSFCVSWVRLHRGTPERPGIMLGIESGGACRGVIFRLPVERRREELLKILRREMPIRWDEVFARWMTVMTDQGPVKALGFPVSRRHRAYLADLDVATVVEALATAAGERGSMAEYLHNTVLHLAERGIHDRYLWDMQDRVARRIEQGPPRPVLALG